MPRNRIVLMMLSIFLISGCATSRNDKDLEVQGLRNQISVLEAQIESRDQEVDSLREALTKATAEEKSEFSRMAGKKAAGEVKFRPTAKQIQIALQNAGYDPGSIDGRLGKQTRIAIKAFQRAHDLKEDGKVGAKTWELLKEYLDKKVK